MKTIKLTENQRLKLWHGKQIKTSQQGSVLYLQPCRNEIVIEDMGGTQVNDFKISTQDLEDLGYLETV